MCVISDEMAYREYLEGREESADILERGVFELIFIKQREI